MGERSSVRLATLEARSFMEGSFGQSSSQAYLLCTASAPLSVPMVIGEEENEDNT